VGLNPCGRTQRGHMEVSFAAACTTWLGLSSIVATAGIPESASVRRKGCFCHEARNSPFLVLCGITRWSGFSLQIIGQPHKPASGPYRRPSQSTYLRVRASTVCDRLARHCCARMPLTLLCSRSLCRVVFRSSRHLCDNSLSASDPQEHRLMRARSVTQFVHCVRGSLAQRFVVTAVGCGAILRLFFCWTAIVGCFVIRGMVRRSVRRAVVRINSLKACRALGNGAACPTLFHRLGANTVQRGCNAGFCHALCCICPKLCVLIFSAAHLNACPVRKVGFFVVMGLAGSVRGRHARVSLRVFRHGQRQRLFHNGAGSIHRAHGSDTVSSGLGSGASYLLAQDMRHIPHQCGCSGRSSVPRGLDTWRKARLSCQSLVASAANLPSNDQLRRPLRFRADASRQCGDRAVNTVGAGCGQV